MWERTASLTRWLAKNAYLDLPFGVAVDATGDLLIADTGNNRIRMVGTNGIINTLAGSGGVGFGGDGYSGDGGQATNATLSLPESVTVDIAGNWFITDTTNNRIRQVATNGIISTVISGGTGLYRTNFLDEPSGVCIDTYGNLFMACPDVPEIFKTRIGEPSLLITNLSAKNAGNYSVIVTSAYGNSRFGIFSLDLHSARRLPNGRRWRRHDFFRDRERDQPVVVSMAVRRRESRRCHQFRPAIDRPFHQ